MRQIKTAENNMAAMDCNVVDAPREKYVRKEEEKIRRRRREKLKRLSNKIKEIMEEEPDIPIMFLYTMNGKTEGQVSPWLRDICHDVAKQMTSASMEHHAEMLLSSKEYRTPTPEEDWRALLSVNAESTPESVLRRLLPLVLRGILKAKCIRKCKKPEGWPDDVNFQDPNRTINNHKISAEELRRVFICLQTSHNIDIEQGNGENPEDASVYLEKENLSTYTIERLLNKGKFSDVQAKLLKSNAPDVVASIVTTHYTTKMVREGFSSPKTFPLTLVQPSTIKREGWATLIGCSTIEECVNMYAPCSPAHLDLLCKVHGQIHIDHYVQQYERIIRSDSLGEVEEIYKLLDIRGNSDINKSFEEALMEPKGYKSASKPVIELERYRLPGMEKRVHRVEMGIDLYEVDIRSLNPMRWLTDAVIDVVARRMKEQIPSKNVYILETFFAQKLLVKGKLNRRPLDMTGCNYLGVENVLAALDVDLEKGAILIVPISNMVHWYLAVLCAESRSIYFLCSMNGRYENEGASLKVYFEKELEKCDIVDKVEVEHKKVPQQRNSFDCGVFLLSYIRNILQNQSIADVENTTILIRNEVSNLCLSK